ncbi:serine/threoninee protein kinase Kin1 [Sporothrix schenckii 1099-18]|uniref:non-specific serine/threonine protein kinase n=2 Tax=Sporothrix schenckii TaxID=29908 RepID=U7PXL0_SPOS1|nr:serine/threoninee protein kinase Kin1 [Sporothrix schenckii 1099-18]ERT00343.1 CAMK/CAMKL/KIN1 protein kinase [Sporothrix schenckii ATCC 58251]KJR85184.1 serine/threoninee protein kinase Kin1 [Sporothrix schenckii 1099-18]
MSTSVAPGGGAEAPLSSPRGKSYSNSVSRSQSTRARPPSRDVPTRAASQHHHSSSRQYSSGNGNGYEPGDDQYHRRSSSRDASGQQAPPPPSSSAPQDSSSRPHRHSSHRSSSRHDPSSRPSADTNQTAAAAAAAGAQPQNNGHQDRSADSRAAASRPTKSRTTIPTTSGKWILGKVIGAGSMGKVRLATKEDGNEQVACKIIPRGSTDDNHATRADKERADQSKEIRTAREAAIVTLLNHPYICGLRDVVRTNHHWYMLFEYVNGGQMLDYIISHGKLKEKPARKFSRQIASALDYCHRNSIVHRDLKIENILISKTGDIKIIDFGLSNLFAPRGHLRTFCGSLYFAAPELLQARAYTGPEVDIWSFGVVLYVLVCGKVPFDDQSIPALHTKIKKGLVDYPNWLSTECKHLISRMLVTDPRQRATMQEVLNHPWMLKGYSGPPENYLPRRSPITLPLEQDVINAMTGFNFGSPEAIKAQLTQVIESEEYQRSVRLLQKEKEQAHPPKDAERKRGFIDFYKRRNSTNSRDTLTTPSTEGLPVGNDPLNAFSPLVSVYYLVREKHQRDRLDHVMPTPSKEKTSAPQLPDIAPPQAAHTNAAAYEMPGERATGGRTRPRSRTHGEDDQVDPTRGKSSSAATGAAGAAAGAAVGAATAGVLLSPSANQEQHDLPKKESTAAGILRRFSTRRRPKEPERLDKDRSHPPVVQVHSPPDQAFQNKSLSQSQSQSQSQHVPAPPRKSFSIRRSRRDEEDSPVPRLRSGSSQPGQQHRDLLSPPLSAGDPGTGYKKGLGRSTSVSSAEFSRRRQPIGGSASRIAKEPPATSGSDHSTINDRLPSGGEAQTANAGMHGRSISLRTKPLSHARRESIQARRQRREEERGREANVPEETDAELGEHSGVSNERLADFDLDKPVYLKGLFSVSTTSSKPVREIRADIKRVLKQLGVEYVEIKGGFNCRHSPSIDLNKVADAPTSPQPAMPGHRRRFSFGGLRAGDQSRDDNVRDNVERGPTTPRTPAGRNADYSNSDVSVDSDPRLAQESTNRVMPAGETTTHVRSDMGGNLVLEFEIFIVKVPVFTLHGVQFKRLSGNTWQYKNMADHILRELKL